MVQQRHRHQYRNNQYKKPPAKEAFLFIVHIGNQDSPTLIPVKISFLR